VQACDQYRRCYETREPNIAIVGDGLWSKCRPGRDPPAEADSVIQAATAGSGAFSVCTPLSETLTSFIADSRPAILFRRTPAFAVVGIYLHHETDNEIPHTQANLFHRRRGDFFKVQFGKISSSLLQAKLR